MGSITGGTSSFQESDPDSGRSYSAIQHGNVTVCPWGNRFLFLSDRGEWALDRIDTIKDAKLRSLKMAFKSQRELPIYSYNCYPGQGVAAQLIRIVRQERKGVLQGNGVPQIFLTCQGNVKDFSTFFSDTSSGKIEH